MRHTLRIHLKSMRPDWLPHREWTLTFSLPAIPRWRWRPFFWRSEPDAESNLRTRSLRWLCIDAEYQDWRVWSREYAAEKLRAATPSDERRSRDHA